MSNDVVWTIRPSKGRWIFRYTVYKGDYPIQIFMTRREARRYIKNEFVTNDPTNWEVVNRDE